MRRIITAASLILAAPTVALSQAAPVTHRFEPDHYFYTFSFAHPPVLTIRSGDRVITRTINSRTVDAAGKALASGPNPQTGPFFITGAEPGDMLKVTFHRLELNAPTAFSQTLIAPYAIDPAYLRSLGEREARSETWTIDKAQGVARTTATDLKPGPLEVPLVPMLGVVATAPDRKEAITTITPGAFGGNMDYAGLVVGTTLMLPVYEPGALLFIGDAHARQGHAEIVGTGLETTMDVEFSVELVKARRIAWPRLENADYIMVLGSARPLLQAFQHATTEMLQWLMKDYGFDERTASMLMGTMIEYEIANVVDPNFTVVAKMRKTNLRR
jgi:amidase